jgi:aryl-alcohol dehydrogenase-like predicted oxidoreductase
MQKRRFGRTGWEISEIGYGMWGLAGWTGSDRKETDDSLNLAVESGVNFFDTAWGYGEGLSERILGELIKRYPDRKLYAATKIPPKNRQWPSRTESALKDVFPADYIVEYTEKSLQNLGTEQIDLLQFHVWEDAWAEEDEWKEAIQKLTKEGKVGAWGISINRWEPDNALKTLETGFIDAVQVIYNIFDQAPEDNLFPLCRKLDIGVIARVPFDEGTLTGTLTRETTFPADDWRSTYFVPENLNASVDHAEALRADIPAGMTMPELALRFILNNSDVHTTIPGMRKLPHVRSNVAVSDGAQLDAAVAEKMKAHRWDRQPTKWSQ